MPYTTNVEKIWDALGSYWTNFEDKALITKFWQSLYDVVSGMNQASYELYLSQGFRDMPAYLTDRHQVYDIIYSVNSPEYSGLINTISGTGYQEFYITPGTFSIPALTYYYYSTSGTLSTLQTLVEGVDYTIQDMERIRFLGSPPFLPNYNQTHFNGNKLSADVAYRVNPSLWGAMALAAGLSDSDIRNRNYPSFSWGETVFSDVEHFKQLTWAIQNGLRKKPTITNIKNLYGLLRGLPFAYESGIYTGTPETTYPILTKGFYALYSNGSAFNFAYGAPNYLNYTADSLYRSHEGSIEAMVKLDAIPVVPQYLVGDKFTWFDGSKSQTQHLFVYFDVNGIIVDIRPKQSYYDETPGISFSYEYSNFNPTFWHIYKLDRDGTDWTLYIDGAAVASGQAPYTMENVPITSGFKSTIGGRVDFNYTVTGTWPITKCEYPLSGYIGYIDRIFSGTDFKTFYMESRTPYASGLASISGYISPDIDSTYGGWSGVNFGLNPTAYEWKEVGIPLYLYTNLLLDQEVEKFQVLISGLEVSDYINNYPLISGYCSSEHEKYKLVVITEPTMSGWATFSYNPEALSTVMTNYLPPELKFITIS